MKIVILGLLSNVAIFLLFAFAYWSINPVYWTTECRAFCAFLVGATTLTTFAYFIIELSNKKQL